VPHLRRTLLVVTAAGVLPTLAACATFSPTTTAVDANYGSGVSARVGTIQARNLLVVGDLGRAGLISGALVNTGTQPQTVTVRAVGQPRPVEVQVAPGALVTLGAAGAGATVVLGALPVPAGATMQVTLSTPSGGEVTSTVPVLAAVREYATLTPGTLTPTTGTPKTG
jgi:hypothetical protein